MLLAQRHPRQLAAREDLAHDELDEADKPHGQLQPTRCEFLVTRLTDRVQQHSAAVGGNRRRCLLEKVRSSASADGHEGADTSALASPSSERPPIRPPYPLCAPA